MEIFSWRNTFTPKEMANIVYKEIRNKLESTTVTATITNGIVEKMDSN